MKFGFHSNFIYHSNFIQKLMILKIPPIKMLSLGPEFNPNYPEDSFYNTHYIIQYSTHKVAP